MAFVETFNSLKFLCWRCKMLQRIPCSTGHLLSVAGLHKPKHYMWYSTEASIGQVTTANVDLKNEDGGDVFGSLARKSCRPKKFQNSLKDNRRQSIDTATLKDSRNNKFCEVDNSSDLWPSVFGTLAGEVEDGSLVDSENERFADDEKDVDESERPYRRLDSQGRKHIPHWYGRRIAKFGRAGKVHEAIQVLEVEMLKEDRVFPNQYVFTVLIGVLGRHGYTQKAFKLFNQMKKFGLAPQDPTYTALFNACSNSPWLDDGRKRANELRQLMREKEHQPNLMTYNAMVKAYAKCSDLHTAFGIVDEAIEAGHKPDGHCYSALLMACISDKEAGLKHAVEVWRVMRKRKVIPVTQHYNLLLRAVRDCSLGNENDLQQLLSNSPKNRSLLVSDQRNFNHHQVESVSPEKWKKNLVLEEHSSVESDKAVCLMAAEDPKTVALTEGNASSSSGAPVPTESSAILVVAEQERDGCGASIFDMDVPNLLNPRGPYGNLVQLQTPISSVGRLALFGGLPGILGHMTKDKATPDIKTFTLLLESIPSSQEAEADLLAAMTLNSVKPDVDFCSLLIRKRNLRKDYAGAKEVLLLMDRINLKPNIRTFGCLAMGCPEKENAVQLFDMMEVKLLKYVKYLGKRAGIFPNTEIFNILMFQSDWDFSYKRHLLIAMKSFKVQPDAHLIQRLETKITKAHDLILKKERGEHVPNFCQTDKFSHNFRKFMVFYKPWLLSTNLEPSVHPWVKFIQPTPVIAPLEEGEEVVAESTHRKPWKVAKKKQQKV